MNYLNSPPVRNRKNKSSTKSINLEDKILIKPVNLFVNHDTAI